MEFLYQPARRCIAFLCPARQFYPIIGLEVWVLDFIYLGAGVIGFGLCFAYVTLCERL